MFKIKEKDSIYEISIQKKTVTIEFFRKLNLILKSLEKKPEVKEVQFKGNFNLGISLENLIQTFKKKKQDNLFQSIYEINSFFLKTRINSVSYLSGVVNGIGLEIAMACDCRLAKKNVIFYFNDFKNYLMPLMGTISRLSNSIGYEECLNIFIEKNKLNYDEAKHLKIISQKNSITKKNYRNKTDNWSKNFINFFTTQNALRIVENSHKKDLIKHTMSALFNSVNMSLSKSIMLEMKYSFLVLKQPTTKKILDLSSHNIKNASSCNNELTNIKIKADVVSEFKNIFITLGEKLLNEGYPASIIENIFKCIGFEYGPLELSDKLKKNKYVSEKKLSKYKYEKNFYIPTEGRKILNEEFKSFEKKSLTDLPLEKYKDIFVSRINKLYRKKLKEFTRKEYNHMVLVLLKERLLPLEYIIKY